MSVERAEDRSCQTSMISIGFDAPCGAQVMSVTSYPISAYDDKRLNIGCATLRG